MTFTENSQTTKGYSAYIGKFGELSLDGLPYQLDVDDACWQTGGASACVELGEYLGKCAADGRRVTVRGYVGACYLRDGAYSAFETTCADYAQFIKEIRSTDVDF